MAVQRDHRRQQGSLELGRRVVSRSVAIMELCWYVREYKLGTVTLLLQQ